MSDDTTERQGSVFDARDRETFREALSTWGEKAQAEMAEEEAAEFIVASKHYGRQRDGSEAELVDELADLRIMQEQLTEFIGREKVEQRITEKMDRLRVRLEERDND